MPAPGYVEPGIQHGQETGRKLLAERDVLVPLGDEQIVVAVRKDSQGMLGIAGQELTEDGDAAGNGNRGVRATECGEHPAPYFRKHGRRVEREIAGREAEKPGIVIVCAGGCEPGPVGIGTLRRDNGR